MVMESRPDDMAGPFLRMYAEVSSSITELEKVRSVPVFQFFSYLQAVRDLRRNKSAFLASLVNKEIK